jgi:two-component system KDP operon response regulator KdpE
MSGETILLIDDDATLCELLTSYLQTAGYRMVAAPNGPGGLRLAAETTPDLVVLDVMMPGMTGWEVCERLRGKDALPGRHDPIPIIMLTAKSEELDKLRGFRLGVDDYVSKPFSFAELAARVGAVLNRARSIPASTHTLTSGDLTVDFDGHHVTLRGQSLELTPTEFHLLETLTRHAHHTVPTEKLLVEAWGPEYAGEIEHVKHYIWTLRKKIEADPGNPKHILTERGFGYRFE